MKERAFISLLCLSWNFSFIQTKFIFSAILGIKNVKNFKNLGNSFEKLKKIQFFQFFFLDFKFQFFFLDLFMVFLSFFFKILFQVACFFFVWRKSLSSTFSLSSFITPRQKNGTDMKKKLI